MSVASNHTLLSGIEPLIVDDNNQSLDVLAAILMGFGINKATRCNSAAEARDSLAFRTFDLVIVDCEMPEEDGFGAVRVTERSRKSPTLHDFRRLRPPKQHPRRCESDEVWIG